MNKLKTEFTPDRETFMQKNKEYSKRGGKQ